MLRAGIIGAGRIAWAYDLGIPSGGRSVSHAACLNRHPDTKLVAIFDPILESLVKFKTEYKGQVPVTCHLNLAEFMAEGLDLIIIASPPEYHKDHLLACFEAQTAYVLLEKPAVVDQIDFDLVQLAYKQNSPNTQMTVNYFRRFLPQVAHLKAYVQKSLKDRTIVQIDVTYSRNLDVNGVHQLDLVGYILDATDVPNLDWLDKRASLDPSFRMTLHGCPVNVLGLPNLGYHGLDLRVTTQDGQMTLTRNGLELNYCSKVPNPDYPGFFHLDCAVPVLPQAESKLAMRDGTYLALCDLVSRTNLSPLGGSGFAQGVLNAVKAGIP